MNNLLREWSESAKSWREHSATIRTMFTPLTTALIEEARISEGQAVLDVAKSPKAQQMKPEEFYDNSFLQKLEDSGFINSLYAR